MYTARAAAGSLTRASSSGWVPAGMAACAAGTLRRAASGPARPSRGEGVEEPVRPVSADALLELSESGVEPEDIPPGKTAANTAGVHVEVCLNATNARLFLCCWVSMQTTAYTYLLGYLLLPAWLLIDKL